MTLNLPTERGATFSPGGEYRYFLWRRWDPSREAVIFIGLNPSTADAVQDDPTLRRCLGFARRWGFGGLGMVNLFALRAAHPAELSRAKDPVGPQNDLWLQAVAESGAPVVAAWGNGGKLHGRGSWAARLFNSLSCLDVTRQGEPRHPLYAPGACEMKPFTHAAGKIK